MRLWFLKRNLIIQAENKFRFFVIFCLGAMRSCIIWIIYRCLISLGTTLKLKDFFLNTYTRRKIIASIAPYKKLSLKQLTQSVLKYRKSSRYRVCSVKRFFDGIRQKTAYLCVLRIIAENYNPQYFHPRPDRTKTAYRVFIYCEARLCRFPVFIKMNKSHNIIITNDILYYCDWNSIIV